MIVPSIGRVVLVNRGMSDQAEPALISYVFSDRLISVGGFDRRGFPFQAERVQLIQDDDEIKDTRLYAQWMPYQKDVAAGKIHPVLHASAPTAGTVASEKTE